MSVNACHSVEDFRKRAKRALPAPIYHYLAGGADGEWSLSNNEEAFALYQLLPEYLKNISEISTRTQVLGAELEAPIILSPTGMSRLFHHHKEPAVARAAAKAGLMYSLSTMATTSIEDVAKASTGCKMFQIYIHKDRSLTKEFVDRAKASGYQALCLTVDTPLAGNRERDRRSGFEMPPRLTLGSLASFLGHPGWTLNFLLQPGFGLANLVGHGDAFVGGTMGVIDYVNDQFDRTVTWDDAAMIIERWGGPFAIKGLQTPDDAERAADIGASAIMISNHGGRQLDFAPAPIDCVRPIRDRIGDALELVVDGGVRRGTDIVKALALGANAVSFGRPYLFALAAGGEAGVDRLLAIMKEELTRNMALLGTRSVDEISERHSMRVLGVDQAVEE